MKPIIQVVLSISPIQHREKIATLPILLITRCQNGNYQSMWRKEENIFYQEVDVVKNKIWRMLQWTVVGRSQIVQHPGFEETGEGCVLNGGYKVVP